MPQDEQTYRRASMAAVIGLAVQLLLIAGLLIASLVFEPTAKAASQALWAAFFQFLGGLPIWFFLWVLHKQHALERIESLETEQLAQSDVQAATIFDQHGEDLRIARKRLANLYRWGLPIVTGLVAVYLLISGLVLFLRYYDDIRTHGLDRSAAAVNSGGLPIGLVVITAAIGFISFIMARYISGMTKVTEWKLLRGGASYLMGGFVTGALLLAAAIVYAPIFTGGTAALFDVATLVVPAFMMLLGVEMVLNLVVSLYSPRRPGEYPRAPFDSRLLGWLTAPTSIAKIINETLNYQFGIEVSRSWFYGLLRRSVTPLFLAGLLVLVLASTIVIVHPTQRAVITKSGRITGEPVGPGMHFKWPWPIGAAQIYSIGEVQQITVGSAVTETGGAILWTNQHVQGKEEYLVTAPTRIADKASLIGAATQPAGRDIGVSLIAAQFVVQYRIDDLDKYIRRAEDPVKMLTTLAESAVQAYLVTQDVDTLLGAGRLAAGSELQKRIQTAADRAGMGVKVLAVAMSGVHPPQEQEVAAKFHLQITATMQAAATREAARQKAIQTRAGVAGSDEQARAISRAIEELNNLDAIRNDPKATKPADLPAKITAAEGKVMSLIAGSRGSAAQTIAQARAEAWQYALRNQADAGRFEAIATANAAAPRYFRARQYLDALAAGFSAEHIRKYIIAGDGVDPTIRLDLKEQGSLFGGLGIESSGQKGSNP